MTISGPELEKAVWADIEMFVANPTSSQWNRRGGWEDKRAVVERLVKGSVIETHTNEAGERYSVAHVTYRFEHPDVTEAPIPIELEALFANVELATNW